MKHRYEFDLETVKVTPSSWTGMHWLLLAAALSWIVLQCMTVTGWWWNAMNWAARKYDKAVAK